MPYAENKGTKIFYDTYGQGTPIVFLHPWTTNGYIWYYQVFPFALTNQVIVIDHRGHGRSDKPQSGYSISEHARDVAAVMDAAKVDRAVLVGNSIGGMIAMQFALEGSGLVGADVWYVGDTALDMECAARAGCTAVLLGALDPEDQGFANFPPQLRFTDFTALGRSLRRE